MKDDKKTFEIGELVKLSDHLVARNYRERLGPEWRGLVVEQFTYEHLTYTESQSTFQEIHALGPGGKIYFFPSSTILSHC